ncbi:hypothetical protein [Granulicella aggregans]|uniref:hypothetical protein n=1 Tax=Granulicella aggregans TaxID=474949 RepID=UPI001C84CFE9|nr:hypothetical protein [Granulicella aggregans]
MRYIYFRVILSLPKSRLSSHRSSHKPRRWGVLLGLLCIALVLLGGTLQVAHTHTGGDLSHSDCSLCVTAHVVAQIVSNPIPVPAELAVAAAPTFKAAPHPVRVSVFALFTRPPPAVSTLA